MNMKKSVIFILMISFSVLIHANRLFLENNFGAEIFCKVNRFMNIPPMIKSGEPTAVGNERVLLGVVPFNINLRNVWVNNLEIKTSRYFESLSGFTPIQNWVEQLSDALLKCCELQMDDPICKENICNKDAVIVVNPSYIGSPWNITIRWETPIEKKVVPWG